MSNSREDNELRNKITTPEELILAINQLFDSLTRTKQAHLLLQLTGLLKMECIPGWKESEGIELHAVTPEHLTLSPRLTTILEAISDPSLWRVACELVIIKLKSHYGSANQKPFTGTEAFFTKGELRQFIEILELALAKRLSNEKVISLGGYSPYPSNQLEGHNNIFNVFLDPAFEGMCLAVKLINPYQLDISNVYIPLTANSRLLKLIEIACPRILRLRNSSLLLSAEQEHETFIISLCQTIKKTGVEELDVSWSLLTSCSYKLFSNLKDTGIKRLNLSYNFLDIATTVDWRKVEKLILNNNITHLNLAGNFFNEIYESDNIANFMAFLEVIKCPSLEFIDLSQNSLHRLSNDLTNKFIEALAGSKKLKRLVLDGETPEIEGYDIKNHCLVREISKDFTTYTIGQQYFHFPFRFQNFPPSRVLFYMSENNFTREILKRIHLAVGKNYSLKEWAAFSLWKQPNAVLVQNGEEYTFQSDGLTKASLPKDVVEFMMGFKSIGV